jgi:thiol-disulfide isomerase/thioredoxin
MKRSQFKLAVIILVSLLNSITIQAQSNELNKNTNDIIKKVVNSLDQYPAISYTFTRETKYHSDNYFDKRVSFFYMEQYAPSVLGIRFQANETDRNMVFNGKQSLYLDLKKLTIDSTFISSKKDIRSNSYLYHSFAMLRQCLPIVIEDIDFVKSLSDTLVNGKLYWKVSFEKKDSYFGLYEGLNTIQQKAELLRRPYELVIDKTNFLPKCFISRYIRGNDGRDFVTMTYDDVNTSPKPPSVESWEYAFYAKNYNPYVPEIRKEEVKTGSKFSGFVLNEYSPKANQLVSSTKYKDKVVLVEFWFRGCGPCMEAMPQYNDLQRSFSSDSFQLVTINVEDTKEEIAFFYNKHKPIYPMLYNGAAMFKVLGFSACPTALLINKEGIIVKKYAGFNAAKLKTDIADALK